MYAPYAFGPFHVDDALTFFDAYPPRDPIGVGLRGHLLAVRGDFAAAYAATARGRGMARELGLLTIAGAIEMQEAEVALVSGDPERAVAAGFAGIEQLEQAGEKAWLSTLAGQTAEALYRLGRDEEAWELTEKAETAGTGADITTRMLVSQVRAKLLVRRGDFEGAERLAREALSVGAGIDNIELLADAWRDLAIVLTAVGKVDEALEALAEAHSLYEGKGHTPGVTRIEELRAQLAATMS